NGKWLGKEMVCLKARGTALYRKAVYRKPSVVQIPIILALYSLGLSTMALIEDGDSSDFNDLGKWLLGGFAFAVRLASSFAFIKLRCRDRKRPVEFLSIDLKK